MKKTLNAMLLAAFLVTGVAQAADMTPPDVLTKNTAQEVIHLIKTDKDIQAGNQKKIHALIESKVLPHFDFERMTMLAVGRNWTKATPAQRKELIEAFKELLVRTYSASLSAYRNQTVTFKPFHMSPGDTDVIVRSEISQPGGMGIPVDYHLEKTAAGWKVYDIIVDSVSLVTNYRSSFNNEIQKSGIDGLIHSLQSKNGGRG